MKSEFFGSAITELQEAVDRLTGQYINLIARVRELEGMGTEKAIPPEEAWYNPTTEKFYKRRGGK